MNAPLLALAGLSVDYRTGRGVSRALHAVDLAVLPGEILGVVGESGSGKSTMLMSILGALPQGGHVAGGRILYHGIDLASADARAWRALRWRQLAYIPQGAMSALNPVLRIGDQFHYILRDHGIADGRGTRGRAEGALAELRLDAQVLDRFPHQLSGGMRQRVCIAMALLLAPDLIVADEPTSALDVMSQRLVIETLARIRDRHGTAIIFVGHDLALQAQIADRIAIMFAGRILEMGPTAAIFSEPLHSYTRRLIAAVPDMHRPFLPVEAPDESERRLWADAGPLVERGKGHLVAGDAAR